MIQPTLLIGATLAFLCAGIYFYVGHVLSQRHQASPGANMAWLMFVTWWFALSLATLSGGFLSLLGAFGMIELPLFTTITIINFFTTCVALSGLMFYLLYLYTGRTSLIWSVGVFYFFYYGLLIYFIEASNPVGVTVNRWNTSLEFENVIRGPLFYVTLFLLVSPQIIASLAYFMLFFRVKSKTQRYRILLVSWSIIIWFLSSLLVSISGQSQQDWWPVVSRLIGLIAALIILFAYQPPSWIKRRLGVAAIAEG